MSGSCQKGFPLHSQNYVEVNKFATNNRDAHPVLESLRLYLKAFTLANVIAEVERWSQQGKSAFEQLVAKLKIRPPDASILDQIFPKPSG